jgi:ABC-type phosphate/phosphonate transport system substrate-binding protein
LWQAANPAQAAELRVFDQSDTYPGLPLITSLHTAPDVLAALRANLLQIATDPAFAVARAPLLISGFELSTLADYQRCTAMQDLAFANGLQRL